MSTPAATEELDPSPALPTTRAADAVRSGPLEFAGRRLVASALKRLQFGQVVLIDGATRLTSPPPRSGPDLPRCVVRVLDRRFYRAAALGGSVGIADAYIHGWWTTDDLPGLVETLTVNYTSLAGLEGPLSHLAEPLGRFRAWLRRNTVTGSRRNIRAHYDLSNEFFALFLDPSMTYSSAIFENGATTLHQAQIEKIDRACRRLALRPTDHLLEIGTGWGALAIHAARTYGCRVTTTTISEAQHDLAAQRIRQAGLEDRISLLKQDYRSLTGRFDKLVSIEMIEAVGSENFDRYFRACSDLLAPDGAALLQAIVIRDQFFARASRREDFLKKHIFPGSCLPSVEAMMRSVRRVTDLALRHLEDIGPHYAVTLAHWRRAFHDRLPDVRSLGFDDRFIRTWDYYLAYCEGAFRAGHTGDVQMLLTKPRCRLAADGVRS